MPERLDASLPTEEPVVAGAGPLRASPLFLTVLVIATCGLIYELIAGTLASYLLGDSVTQFSTVIGTYLFAMGIGSYLSRFIQRGVAYRFVDVELGVALVGGTSAPVLFLTFGYAHDHFRVVLYALVLLTGTLVGLEIPLLLRILRGELIFKDLVAQVLTFDYIGALLASILFPLIFMPRLGLVRTSLVFGLLNALMGLWCTRLLRSRLGNPRPAQVRGCLVTLILAVGLFYGESFTQLMEEEAYGKDIVFARTSPYQRLVVTQENEHFQLFLSGNLQFNSLDEYRYHEALVHPAFAGASRTERILVAGGGDGLALREILRHPAVREVVLVDLDPAMTELGQTFPALVALNRQAFSDPRVRVINDDAMVWLQERAPLEPPFDVAIIDFPDPNNFSLGKLYTSRFYRLLEARLSPEGIFTVQSTSPLLSRQSFWCIVGTIESLGLHALPYHVAVPSFSEWGFVMASRHPLSVPDRVLEGTRYLTPATMRAMFEFPQDMARLPAEVNRLNNQVLVHYYDREMQELF